MTINMSSGMTNGMSIRKLIFSGAICGVLITGCITTTSGPPQSVPDDAAAAELTYQLGARYYKNGQYALARDRLLLSIEKDSKRAVVHSTLALTYEALGNVRLATESYKTAMRVAPSDFDVQNAYAVFLCRYKDYDEAKKLFDKAIALEENSKHFPDQRLTDQIFRERDRVTLRELRTRMSDSDTDSFGPLVMVGDPCGAECMT